MEIKQVNTSVETEHAPSLQRNIKIPVSLISFC